MKKLFALLLAMTMVLSLAACGGGEQTANLDDAPETSATTDTTDETQESTEETTAPVVTEPAETEPAETEPVETTPPATEPAETTPTHTHSYTSKVTKAATCTEKGVKTYTCSCGNSYTEEIKITDHNWGEWVVIEPAGTYYEGISQRTCKNCTAQEDKTLPIERSIESTVDTSVNLTGTEYEAAIRQYACDNAPGGYMHLTETDGSGFYFDFVSTDNVLNFLSLSSAKTFINVTRREGQAGMLYCSNLEGISPHKNLSAEELVRKTAEECSAMLNRPFSEIYVVDFTTADEFGDITEGEYSSFDDIPDDIWQKIAQNKADISVHYEFPNSYVSAGFGVSGGNKIMFGIYYFEALNSLA